MKCPKCDYEISKSDIASFIGGFSSEKKRLQAIKNVTAPCHEGKKRGWTKGKKRKIIKEEENLCG
jgi:hypothetical protein